MKKINKSRLRGAKRYLWGVTLKINTKRSGVVIGMLASESLEKRIQRSSPLKLNFDDYLCVVNVRTGVASFLMYDDIISVGRC